MCMSEKGKLKEKEIMIHAKVKLLRLTRTVEGGRTVRTMETGYRVMQLCNVGVQMYLFRRCNAMLWHNLGPVGIIWL